jgi:hypothetical protein
MRRPGFASLFAAGFVLASLAVLPAAPGATLHAQASDPFLDLVEKLMEENRYEEARGVLLDWWEEGGRDVATRGALQRGLWLRAILTVDSVMAEQDFRRLVIEFPGGPWSDGALMRLARGAELVGDREAARAHLDLLLRDYPGSSLRPEARQLRERLEREGGPGL